MKTGQFVRRSSSDLMGASLHLVTAVTTGLTIAGIEASMTVATVARLAVRTRPASLLNPARQAMPIARRLHLRTE
jgi:hypothetical protein